MIRLPQAIVAVMSCTLAAGAAGGIVGAGVGRLAPDFVLWIYNPLGQAGIGAVDPTGFGTGLGIVCGLLMGCGTGLFLVAVLAMRDAYLYRVRLLPHAKAREDDFN
ncbi:hypothetical protein [Aquisphaera giovannonii]|nr:hypothetical protein [Aquisphaera giovannonii]